MVPEAGERREEKEWGEIGRQAHSADWTGEIRSDVSLHCYCSQ
jgi:hypothetical protein